MAAHARRRQQYSSSHRSNSREKKDAEASAAVQSKIFCDEAASHVKAGNYKKAMRCYNMVRATILLIFQMC